MDQLRSSMKRLRETAVALSARAKAIDVDTAHNKRELKDKERTIADLGERLRLFHELVRISARKQAVQRELAELEDK
ncbi:hypothetical protein B0H19DRAFT_1117539 [Mycena capillaripes]|nr:hypothetical protein B0H19DRAFT_1117539 [Mycena capillaripes]